ncbi:MAG: phosphoribosylformylglycinamidine synthase subunit PurQ [Deltaproteobacteria bacterium]|jgi:phosphoribosylformylglycinamidine synthase|nr:phosphoribosylformylglycinamidine synthase subunit PurQ [Deltaproteobacteria bacterium]MBW2483298.1 phosphoribosylformylglycinamidine synthase subunit PurQ [Deltaproteobacteria bacterium]
MPKVNALVLTGYGLNCDNETAYAFELAGARAARVHINSLIDGTARLDEFQILAFIGGFSWGDDHGAGVIQSVRLKTNIGDQILEFVGKGNLVLGICNGFQSLANLGLLPALDDDYQKRSVALTFNDCGNFRNQWVTLKADPNSPCIFTRGIDLAELPVRHGEGKFYTDDATLKRLLENHQVALQYAKPDGQVAEGSFPHNPNGSIADVAGICDPTGRIFGLMPHPEAYNHWTNHPDWTRRHALQKRQNKTFTTRPPVGIQFFQNAVDFIRS